MSAKAILAALPYAIKKDVESDMYRSYMARCARVITENTAKMSGGGFITVEYDDLINVKQQRHIEKGAAKKKICDKLSS